jgi:hypothetical protein
VTLEPPVRREIVALTLPDLARVPTVAATLEHLARASAGQDRQARRPGEERPGW